MKMRKSLQKLLRKSTDTPRIESSRESSIDTKIFWTMPQGSFQRMNVVDGAPVQPGYLDSLEVVSTSEETISIFKNAKDIFFHTIHGISLHNCEVTQCIGKVKHHLKGGDRYSHHHEVWVMMYIKAEKNVGWLWPIGRTSDFYDVSTLDVHMLRRTNFVNGIIWLDISNRGLLELPSDMSKMKTLKRLECHCNSLSEVPDSISALTSLYYLSLHSNKIEKVTRNIIRLQNLKWLSLHANKLTSIPLLPISIERVSFHINNIDEIDIDTNIAHCQKLIAMSMFQNNLTHIPKALFKNLPFCTTLGLQCNQLEEIPESIGDMESLIFLWLYNNKLTQFPASVKHLQKLKKLWVSQNSLTSLPVELGECKALEEVYCSENNLNVIPESMTLLASLKKLHVDRHVQVPDPILHTLINDATQAK